VDFIYSNETEARKFLPKYTNLPEPFAMKIPWENWVKVEEYNKTWGQPYLSFSRRKACFRRTWIRANFLSRIRGRNLIKNNI